jgi:hypothetical protein
LPSFGFDGLAGAGALVPVAGVSGVGMTIVPIVRVVPVLNGLMATIRTVLVRMTGVLRVLIFHLLIICRDDGWCIGGLSYFWGRRKAPVRSGLSYLRRAV